MLRLGLRRFTIEGIASAAAMTILWIIAAIEKRMSEREWVVFVCIAIAALVAGVRATLRASRWWLISVAAAVLLLLVLIAALV